MQTRLARLRKTDDSLVLGHLQAAMGQDALAAGQPEAAERAFRTALSLDRRVFPAHLGLADLLAPAEPRRAAAVLEDAVRADPDRAYLAFDRLARALRRVRRALALRGALRGAHRPRPARLAGAAGPRARAARRGPPRGGARAAAARDRGQPAGAPAAPRGLAHAAGGRRAGGRRRLAISAPPSDALFYRDPHLCTSCRYRADACCGAARTATSGTRSWRSGWRRPRSRAEATGLRRSRGRAGPRPAAASTSAAAGRSSAATAAAAARSAFAGRRAPAPPRGERRPAGRVAGAHERIVQRERHQAGAGERRRVPMREPRQGRRGRRHERRVAAARPRPDRHGPRERPGGGVRRGRGRAIPRRVRRRRRVQQRRDALQVEVARRPRHPATTRRASRPRGPRAVSERRPGAREGRAAPAAPGAARRARRPAGRRRRPSPRSVPDVSICEVARSAASRRSASARRSARAPRPRRARPAPAGGASCSSGGQCTTTRRSKRRCMPGLDQERRVGDDDGGALGRDGAAAAAPPPRARAGGRSRSAARAPRVGEHDRRPAPAVDLARRRRGRRARRPPTTSA